MTTRRNPWMDLLRVTSLVMVILFHSTFIGPQTYPQFVARHLVFAHQIGASLLLVLSANLVASSLADPARATTRWWFSRIARLLPGFVVGTLAATIALDWLAPEGMYRVGVGDLFANLAMLWNWNGYHHWDYVDGSYWTLPVQLAAFTLAPWLRRTRLGHGRGLRVVLWAAVLVPLAQWPLAQGMGGLYDSVVDGLGLYRWHLFVAGVAAWMLSTGRLRHGHGLALLGACVAAHAVQNGYWVPGQGLVTDRWSVIGVGLGVLALLLAVRVRELGIEPPRSVARVAARLAGISYRGLPGPPDPGLRPDDAPAGLVRRRAGRADPGDARASGPARCADDARRGASRPPRPAPGLRPPRSTRHAHSLPGEPSRRAEAVGPGSPGIPGRTGASSLLIGAT